MAKPKTLTCRTHKNQPRYGCALCDQAIKAMVDKMSKPFRF